ncbi:MAG: 4-hydroxythreonine-4-phosphate dehydrogenase PdxA, partial [Lachnospiraceae bacterium]|nr:4-hydroxythreonine-4-phosphate dehydrogenase PdxA [Lachnospiraceae bacterium]
MKIIGITMGDPAGVGPEISVKALAANEEYRNQTIIFGSVKIIQYYLELLKIQILINVIDEPEDFKPGCINVLNVMDVSFDDLQIGVQSPIAGDAAYQYIERAIRLAMEGRIGPIVTAPLNKAALHDAGHVFDGHTEIFATLTNTSQYTMMLWSERMSVVHASTHVSLEEACRRVTK